MITALVLAAGAALFTILGFRELFEPSLKITYMAASIELGKIVAVSALYRLRNSLGWMTKSLLFVLILIAMAVTSMGVYGYLSSSYQKDSLAITQNAAKLDIIDARKVALVERLAGMDSQIQKVPEAYVTKRMELITAFNPERQLVLQELDEINESHLALTLDRIDRETEFGAILVLSRSVSWLDANSAMLYFILAVIFIFDPMAIALTYAANVGYDTASKGKVKVKDENTDDDTPIKVINHADDFMVEMNARNGELSNTLLDISEQLKHLREHPTNSRSDVIDSMRNKKA
jgi:hypothetical protein